MSEEEYDDYGVPLWLKKKYPKQLDRVYCGFYPPPGWVGLIDQLLSLLTKQETELTVAQVKSKFGGLRFYADNLTNEENELISQYETMSYEVCESCGKPDVVECKGHIAVTMCEACYKDYARVIKR